MYGFVTVNGAPIKLPHIIYEMLENGIQEGKNSLKPPTNEMQCNDGVYSYDVDVRLNVGRK